MAAFTVPVFRSGLRSRLTFFEFVLNHTIWGPPVEFIPEEDYERAYASSSLAGNMSSSQTAANTGRLKDLEEQKIPTGFRRNRVVIPADEVLVVKLGRPWISFTMANRSNMAGVYMSVNDRDYLTQDAPIPEKSNVNINMGYPKIETIYMKADSPGVAVTVDLYGVEGSK